MESTFSTFMLRLPPTYRRVEGYPENLEAPSCFNCLFLRTHELTYICHRYIACVLSNYVCDGWKKRLRALGWEELELSKEDLEMIERRPIRDLQKPFSSHD